MEFCKPPTTFHEQIELLKKRGLIIENTAKALQKISIINYYRLSSYFPPFQIDNTSFVQGTSIDKIFELYEFDQKIRTLVSRALENVEITLRTRIAYYFSHKYGPFAYSNQKYFSSDFDHSQWYCDFQKNLQRSRENFIEKFFKEYDENKVLPLWMAVEIRSFGHLSLLFKGLNKIDYNSISKKYFGIEGKLLLSWIHTLVYIRNLCAHHGRIWNRTLAIAPKVPKKLPSEWKGILYNKVFCVFLIFKKLMTIPEQWESWRNDLFQLLEEYKDIDKKMMGFPNNWKRRLM